MSDLPELDWSDIDEILNGAPDSANPDTNSHASDTPVVSRSTSDSERPSVLFASNLRTSSDDSEELTPQIVEAESAKEEALAELSAVDEEYNAIASEIALIEQQSMEIQRQLRLLTAQAEEKKGLLWDIRSKKREAQRRVESAERQIANAQQAIIVAEKQRKLLSSFEERAADKMWFTGRENGDRILPHQWEGATMLAAASRAILGDQMGLGKTITTIAAMDLVDAKRILVITPAEVTSNFTREIRMWAEHRTVANMKGMTKAERNTLLDFASMMDEFIIVVNYEAWRKDFALVERLIDLAFDTVVLDEAHTIKNVTSQTFLKVHEIIDTVNICPHDKSVLRKVDGLVNRQCPKCFWAGESYTIYDEDGNEVKDNRARDLAVRSVKNTWFLTGTPILNEPEDLFPLLHIIDKNTFYRRNTFLRDYAYQDYSGKWSFRAGGLKSLTAKLSGRFLARTLEDAGIELPPQMPIVHDVELDEAVHFDQIKVIKQLAEFGEIVLDSGKVISPLAFIALLTRQRQANVWPGGIQIKDEDGKVVFSVSEEIRQSAKIDKAMELIREFVGQGQRIAVFSQFTQALKEVAARCEAAGISVVEYHGETSESLREEVKRNWDKSVGEEKKWDVIVTHYKSGGQGLNLTNATHTIILDQEWNPGKRDQAYARTRRLGQDETTFVHILNVSNTIDQWVQDLIDSKEQMIEGFTSDTRDMQQSYLEALRGGKFSG